VFAYHRRQIVPAVINFDNFWQLIVQQVGPSNKICSIFPPHQTNDSALPGKQETHKLHLFTSTLAIQVQLHSFLNIAVQLTMIESVGYISK